MSTMEALSAYLSWPRVVGTGVVYLVSIAVYRLFLDPLARFPGPRLAAVTRYYEGYYDLIQDGQYTFKIRELHKKYGPIVRISPYELHVNDPAYFDTLYRQDGVWDKYAWAVDAFLDHDSAIFTADHHRHKTRHLRIPAGTPVGMTLILLHTNQDMYPDPQRYDPNRWMDPSPWKTGDKLFMPFSRGTRNCLGIHLAWAEMYTFISNIVQRYEFTYPEAKAEDFECTSDQFAISVRGRGHLLAVVSERKT